MLRKFKITYVEEKTTREPPEHQEELIASSKYDAKTKFYKRFPRAEIVKVEVEENGKENT